MRLATGGNLHPAPARGNKRILLYKIQYLLVIIGLKIRKVMQYGKNIQITLYSCILNKVNWIYYKPVYDPNKNNAKEFSFPGRDY